MRRAAIRAVIAAAIACGAASCGGKKGTLDVRLVVPAGEDPFVGASQVRITVGDPPLSQETVALAGGMFELSVKWKPKMGGTPDTAAILVEALAADGTVVARGRSPVLQISPADELLAVWVGSVGRFGVVPRSLASPRTGMAIAAIPRLGVIFAGGEAAGQPVTDVEVLDLYSFEVVKVAPLPTARRGAVAVGYDRSDFTGAVMLVGGASSDLLLFDPLSSTAGGWLPSASDASLARSFASLAPLPAGGWLLSGGSDAMGQPLRTAATITLSGRVAVSPVAAPMDQARVGHTVTPTSLASGEAALLFGGTTSGPAAETFSVAAQQFSRAVAIDAPTRTGHAAAQLPDKRVVVIGGRDPAAPGAPVLGSALVLQGDTVASRPDGVLATPRALHTATVLGTALFVCGGVDGAGKPIADCEILDAATLARRATIRLAAGRAGHTAMVLDTGVLALGGGTGDGGAALSTIELYTP